MATSPPAASPLPSLNAPQPSVISPPPILSPPPPVGDAHAPPPSLSSSPPPPAPPTPAFVTPPPAPSTTSPPPPAVHQSPPPPPTGGSPDTPTNSQPPPQPQLGSPPLPSPSPSLVPPSSFPSPILPSNSPPPVRFSPPPPAIVLAPPSPPPTNQSSNNRQTAPATSRSSGFENIGTAGTVAIAVAITLSLFAVFGAVSFCIWNRKKRGSGNQTHGDHVVPTTVSSSSQSGPQILKVHVASAPNSGSGSGNMATYSPYEPGGLGNSRLWFTYEELVDATNGFSAHNLLGEGGFGSVYKGRLGDGREVAVKKLKVRNGQGDREFRSEVEIISRVHHRHLVSIVGYCISEETRLLIYDYLPNNTLYFHLHGEGAPVLDWATRVRIAVGAARGIAYLHEDCHPRIIHRDIKSSNILLDSNFEARVSDFGLAKFAGDANTHITTRVMGTFGYMAPEYASSGKLTEKSDVYSFGVVLLELISGRKPVEREESLVEWARPLLHNALEMEEFGVLPDPKLQGNYVASEMFRLVEAAAACVRNSSAKRPAMGQVARAFDSMAISDLTNGMRVGESEIFNPPLQSQEVRLFWKMAFGGQSLSTDSFQDSSPSTSNPENSAERLEDGVQGSGMN